jgi:hypothetical protein
VIRGNSITDANYYRVLGTIEPGQCSIIEDEGDRSAKILVIVSAKILINLEF